MAIESAWMGRIEQHTAGSLYSYVQKLAADMAAGFADLGGRSTGVTQDVAGVREELGFVREEIGVLLAAVAELGRKLDEAATGRERVAEELVAVLERARERDFRRPS
jgi:hypothetical protein